MEHKDTESQSFIAEGEGERTENRPALCTLPFLYVLLRVSVTLCSTKCKGTESYGLKRGRGK